MSIQWWVEEAGEWAEKTFPASTEETVIAHLRDEVNNELHEGCEPDEIADCMLLLFHLAYKRGIDLNAVLHWKFAKNKTRKWQTEPNEKGFMSHIDGQ